MTDYEALAEKVRSYLDALDAYRAKDYSNKLFDAMGFAEDELREHLGAPEGD